MNRIIVIGLLVMAAASHCVGAPPPDGSVDSPTHAPLRIVAEHYPPYEFFKDGVATGINVDVTTLIMERLGVPFTFVPNYPFSRAWALIRSGNAEAIASMSCQPHRHPYLYSTQEQREFPETGKLPRDYLWITRYVFFVNRHFLNSLKYESYAQLKEDNYRIGIIKDYSYDGKLLDADLNTVQFISPKNAIRALQEGRIDMLPLDKTAGLAAVAELDLSESIALLPRVIFEKPYHILFSRKSSYPELEALSLRYYEELLKIRNSGEYADIVNRYITPKYSYPLPRPLVFVAEEWAPFESLKNGVPVGIDVDVLKHVMGRLNLPYDIQLYPWSRAWMLAERGIADAVLSVSYKASRESVLFYTPRQRAFATTGVLPSDYLWMSEYVFFVKKSRAEAIQFESYEQLKRDGYRVGTNKDYTYSPEFMAAELSARQYPDTRSGLTALVNEEIDLYPMDKSVGLAELSNIGFSDTVTFIPSVLLSKPYLAPFTRNSDMPHNEDVMNAFNNELLLMRKTGEYDDIVREYHKAQEKKD